MKAEVLKIWYNSNLSKLIYGTWKETKPPDVEHSTELTPIYSAVSSAAAGKLTRARATENPVNNLFHIIVSVALNRTKQC
jgi:hypothetical protein